MSFVHECNKNNRYDTIINHHNVINYFYQILFENACDIIRTGLVCLFMALNMNMGLLYLRVLFDKHIVNVCATCWLYCTFRHYLNARLIGVFSTLQRTLIRKSLLFSIMEVHQLFIKKREICSLLVVIWFVNITSDFVELSFDYINTPNIRWLTNISINILHLALYFVNNLSFFYLLNPLRFYSECFKITKKSLILHA